MPIERARVRYRFRRFEQDHEVEFGTLTAAAYRALLDTDMQEAIPLEISRSGKSLFRNPSWQLYCGKELRAFAKSHHLKIEQARYKGADAAAEIAEQARRDAETAAVHNRYQSGAINITALAVAQSAGYSVPGDATAPEKNPTPSESENNLGHLPIAAVGALLTLHQMIDVPSPAPKRLHTGYDCPRCRGTGKVIFRRCGIAWDRVPCTLCDGQGDIFDLLYGAVDYEAIADERLRRELVAIGGTR